MVFKIIEETPSEENKEPLLERHIARSGARAFESLAGLPKDIFSFIENIAKKGYQKVTNQEPFKTSISEILFPGLKTSEEIREMEKPIFGEKLEPQSEKERIADEFVSLASTLAIPEIGFGNIARASKAAGLGIGLKELSKKFNAPSNVQNFLQFIGTFAGSKAPKFKDYKNLLYKQSENLLPKTANTSAKPLLQNIENLEKIARKTIPTKSKETILKTTNKLKKFIKNDQIKIDDLVELKKDLNEITYELPKGRQQLLKGLNNNIGKLIENYGKNKNPQFLKAYKDANRFYGELAQAHKYDDFFKSVKRLENYGLASAILTGKFKMIPAIYGIKGTTNILQNLLTRPGIRKYYFEAIKEASKQNKGGVLNAAKNLNIELEKEFKQKKSKKFKIVQD